MLTQKNKKIRKHLEKRVNQQKALLKRRVFRRSGVRHVATGLWSSEDVFCRVMNHGSLSGSLKKKSGFGPQILGFSPHILCYVLTRLGSMLTLLLVGGQTACV